LTDEKEPARRFSFDDGGKLTIKIPGDENLIATNRE
jgi:hypothetical protein